MKYKLLDCIVLLHDLPDFELRAGDLETVVEIYEPDSLVVEFGIIKAWQTGRGNDFMLFSV